jgi:hypothetical protein
MHTFINLFLMAVFICPSFGTMLVKQFKTKWRRHSTLFAKTLPLSPWFYFVKTVGILTAFQYRIYLVFTQHFVCRGKLVTIIVGCAGVCVCVWVVTYLCLPESRIKINLFKLFHQKKYLKYFFYFMYSKLLYWFVLGNCGGRGGGEMRTEQRYYFSLDTYKHFLSIHIPASHNRIFIVTNQTCICLVVFGVHIPGVPVQI